MYDFLIIGGGIVGVSTAWQLQQRYPQKKILLLEKESNYAEHQTGHNSGVIHAGVYYAPGSLKAQFCREGAQATVDFCRQQGIPYDQCGKLLVATSELELSRMQALYERCRQNRIEVELLSREQLREREPNITGLGAIWVRATGIVDFSQVTAKMAEQFIGLGGEVQLATEVVGLTEESDRILVETATGRLETDFLICCAGLMADRLVGMLGIAADFQIIPFRGEYYQLPEKHNRIVNHLIYPIPDPELPFLGVHLTRMIDGSVTVGPNAVLGFKREGYSSFNFDLGDTLEMLHYPGFWKVMRENLRSGLKEMKNSLYKPGYLQLVRKYCPQLQLADLGPCPAGIRAQAVRRDGSLVHDFLFTDSPRSLHVCNAPSPAATSAIPIGHYICAQVAERLSS